jgi:hypothetical protein
MQTHLSTRLVRQSPLLSALLVLLLPLCLVGGGATVAVAAAGTCQPQAVTPDFCTKVTHHGDVAAVVPEPVASPEAGGLTPHLLYTQDSFTHPLVGYLRTPSGRSPPFV